MNRLGAFAGAIGCLLSTIAQADFLAEQKAFCSEPVTYVCEEAKTNLAKFEQRRVEAGDRALKNAVAATNGMIPRRVQDQFAMLIDGTRQGRPAHLSIEAREVAPFIAFAKAYLRELEKLIPTKRTDLAQAVESIKKLHLERAARATWLSDEAKLRAKRAIENVRAVSYSDLIEVIEQAGIDPNREPNEAIKFYVRVGTKMSTDFMSDNASVLGMTVQKEFNDGTRRSEDMTLILLSPGMFLRLASFQDPDLIASNATIAHEVSHLYQPERASDPGAACFATEFANSQEMIWPSLQGEEKTKAFWITYGEFLADIGGAEIVTASLKAKAPQATLKELRTLKAHLQTYCFEKASKHASGQFRIEKGYRANPVLSAYFCGGFPEPVTCTEKGRYPAK